MALLNRFAVKLIKTSCVRYTSTAAPAVQVQEELTQSFRTKESNPAYHTMQHFNKIYTIPPDDVKTAFINGIPSEYVKQNQTFTEFCLLIREPAIELLSYLKQTDFTKPVNRYVIYGEDGCGKSSTLLHIIHYGYTTKKIIVNLQHASKYFIKPQEVANSETQEGILNLPIKAAEWLINFKKLNLTLLTESDLRLSKTYEWGLKDKTLKDEPLLTLIDLGITRIKYASDIMIVLMKELKSACTAGKCKVLVAVDQYNSFFMNQTKIKDETKKFVPASKIFLTQAFLEISKADWCNGQIVVTVDIKVNKERMDSHLPRYLLGKEGFEHLDPFLPICIGNYTPEEFDTMIEYYKDRKWIRQITPEGQQELRLLSGNNPYQLITLCKHL